MPFKEQIDACYKNTIRVPIFITNQWDELTLPELLGHQMIEVVY